MSGVVSRGGASGMPVNGRAWRRRDYKDGAQADRQTLLSLTDVGDVRWNYATRNACEPLNSVAGVVTSAGECFR